MKFLDDTNQRTRVVEVATYAGEGQLKVEVTVVRAYTYFPEAPRAADVPADVRQALLNWLQPAAGVEGIE